MALRVAVVGAAGQLGSSLCRLFSARGADVRALTRSDVDLEVLDSPGALERCSVDVIINCASYNNVDGAEDDAERAMRINRDGVAALASAADRCGAMFIHYSTDFVFDGENEEPYSELDAPNPLGAYGRSKAAGELAAASAARHYVLRLSIVFGGATGEGAGGRSIIDRTIDATLAGQEVVAFHDRTVTPSYTHDVAAATWHLVDTAAKSGLYHCTSTGATVWSDLATEIAAMLGRPARVRAISMRDVPMRAARPLRCALSNNKLAAAGVVMPHWRDAVARHVASRTEWATAAAG
jgi:dTDP-4-dehydrorhamnose reductase